MQVRSAASRFGVPSSTPAEDPFAGLGDLPGLAHVGPDIDCQDRVVVATPVRIPLASLVDFAALSKRLWLVWPPSRLLQPLEAEIDATRRALSQRTATRIDVAGPAEGTNDTPDIPGTQNTDSKDQTGAKDPPARKRKRDSQEPALAFADPRDGLTLVRPDSHNLEEVVAAMARQLVRQEVADGGASAAMGDAHELGQDLGQQLGGSAMDDAVRGRVLRAVLQLALPPQASDSPQAGAEGAGIGPLERISFGKLGNFLRGLRTATHVVGSEAYCGFLRALLDLACRLSLDPLHAPGVARCQVTDYSRRSGPLELVGWTLGLGSEDHGLLRAFVGHLLRHLVESCLPGASATDRAWHVQCLLASLEWLPRKMQPMRAADLNIFVQVVAATSSSYAIDAGAVGIGLARALAGVRCATLDAQVLTILGLDFETEGYPAFLGAIAATYLPESTGQAVAFESFLTRVPQMHPHAVGRLAYRLALAEGRTGRWDPADGAVGSTSRLRLCVDRLGRWDPGRQRAVLHGLLGAVGTLSVITAGFTPLNAQLRESIDILLPAGHALRPTVLDVLAAARDPRHVFAIARDRERVQWAPLHMGLVLSIYKGPSHQFVSDVVRFLLSEKAQGSGRLQLLLRVATDHPVGITPMRLPKVRALLLEGLESKALSLNSTIKALKSLYDYTPLRSKLDLAAEVAALTASSMAAQLQPVLDMLGHRREPPAALAVS